MPTTLLNGISPPGNSFVLREHKIVYIATTKAASSSLRWMIADLAGEDLKRFYRASGSHQSRYMTIHTSRTQWQFAIRLNEVDDEQLSEISTENGWFVFAVIRDPWRRLWSAWQSKFLVQHTPYLREYGNQPWFPRMPESPGDILEDWSAFVTARPWETHEALKIDRHFMPQVVSVRPRGVNYTKIYDMAELADLEADLHSHLRRLGLDKELYLPRANENAVPMPAAALDDGIEEIITTTFSDDLAEWGERWHLESIKRRLQPMTADAVRSVRLQVDTNARIGDLSKELKRAQHRIAAYESDGANGAASSSPASAADDRPAGFRELRRSYPWPNKPRYPKLKPVGRRTEGFELVADKLAELGGDKPVVVLEVGAELGGSTRRSLAVPGTYVVSVDPWEDGHNFRPWPRLAHLSGVPDASFQLFLSFNFAYRERLVALREASPRGLLAAYDAGLRPQLVYLDADSRTDAVLRDLTVCSALFPDAILCGNNWAWQPKRTAKYDGAAVPVQAAVLRWAAFHDQFVETRSNTWLLDPSRAFAGPRSR